MLNRIPLLTSLTLLVALSACQPAPAGLSEADEAAIRAVSDRFATAMNAGDHAAIGALYTTDAVLMPPNMATVRGREAIQAFMGAFPPTRDAQFTIEAVSGSGDIAYVVGTYSMTMMIDSVGMADRGKFIEIRERGADNSWLLKYDIFNSDMPLPGM